MGKTILILEDGRVTNAIDEENWGDVRVENGRLVTGSEEVISDEIIGGEDGNAFILVDKEDEARLEEEGAATHVPNPACTAAPGPTADAGMDAGGMNEAAGGMEAGGSGCRPGSDPAFGGARTGVFLENGPIEGSQPRSSAGGGKDRFWWTTPKKVTAGILAVAVCFAAGFGGGMAAISAAGPKDSGTGGLSGNSITISPGEDISITEGVAAKVIPSVVGITSTVTRTYYDFFFREQTDQVGGTGTGIIVDESGYILTNSHVVLDGRLDSMTVLLSDGRDTEGEVLWNDQSLDLAIVKIEADNLVAAELGDSDEVRIGAYAVAIGNPLGLNFQSSVSQGIVSGLNRRITTASTDERGATVPIIMEDLIQVDAAINQGNSGGPLVNSRGQVIGINTAKAASGEGMGFAIPINAAKPIVERVKETGEFNRVYMGISIYNVSDWLRENPHMDLGVENGAYVYEVSENSPAAAAGIQPKDIITAIDGREVHSNSQLIRVLLNYREGDTVEVSLVRNGNPMSVKVTLSGPQE